MAKVHLISVWPLKDGCPDALIKTLQNMPDNIVAAEPGTLSYAINLPAPDPLTADSDSKSSNESKEIIFILTIIHRGCS